MLGSGDAAEEAVQDALVRAFDHLAECREPDKFAGWLFLILRNRCFAERRRRTRMERPLELADEAFAASGRPDGELEQAERSQTLTAALDTRVMATVRRHAASPVRRAWRRLTAPRDVELRLRVRPWTVWAGALAAAAAVVLLVSRAPAPSSPPHDAGLPVRVASRDSVYVRFVLYAPGAQRVTVAGTFNQWDQNAAPLRPAGTNGVWATTLAVPIGQHQYAFIVDGERWVADPRAPAVDDGFGRRNSVVTVIAQGARTL